MLDAGLPLRHPSVLPPQRDLYVRDWRGTNILPESERTLCVDAWEPVPRRGDILYPGVWYVLPEINDASVQRLPWRPLTHRERAWIMRTSAAARDWHAEVHA